VVDLTLKLSSISMNHMTQMLFKKRWFTWNLKMFNKHIYCHQLQAHVIGFKLSPNYVIMFLSYLKT
jgi:hypothetical protein